MASVVPLRAYPELVLSLKSSAVLVADVVESVRLTEEGEQDAVERWVRFVGLVKQDILPPTNGRLVKSTGDGFLLEFPSVREAVEAAFMLQTTSAVENDGVPDERKEMLRVGIETGTFLVNDLDVFGADVNRAARLAGLARGGEIVISAKARDQITAILDAEIEDMGENYLKNIREPVRAYRLRPPGMEAVARPRFNVDDLLPSIAVIPFSTRAGNVAPDGLGDVIAEELIRAMSRSRYLNVISRLSTAGFRDRPDSFNAIHKHLNARFILSGRFWADADAVVLDAELMEARTGRRIWGDVYRCSLRGVIEGQIEALDDVIGAVSLAVMNRELDRVRVQPMPTLETYSLLMGAISLMNRFSRDDFDLSRKILEELVERAPRYAAPKAWLASWYTLRVQQGWSSVGQVPEDTIKSAQLARQALDIDPDSSLANTISGLVSTIFYKRFDDAETYYSAAVEKNPNDSLAWLLKGAMHAFSDNGKLAVSCCETARKLSPLDPHGFFYDSLLASAHITAGNYDQALAFAESSIKANRMHASTLRALAVAQFLCGDEGAARATIKHVMVQEPDFSISNYRARAPSAAFKIGAHIMSVFRQLGVPE